MKWKIIIKRHFYFLESTATGDIDKLLKSPNGTNSIKNRFIEIHQVITIVTVLNTTTKVLRPSTIVTILRRTPIIFFSKSSY